MRPLIRKNLQTPACLAFVMFCGAALHAQPQYAGSQPVQLPQLQRPPSQVPPSSSGLTQAGLLGSRPSGQATADPIDLTIQDAIARALRYNLGLSEGEQSVRQQRAQRLRELSALMPQMDVRPSVAEQQVNLAAFGFSGFPGVPQVVGPFTVVDLRGYLSQSVFNLQNLRNYRASQESAAAAEFSMRDIREQVVVAATGLYLQAIAASAQAEAQRAQLTTAEVAYRQAVDRRNAGTAPGIDVLRAQVELQAERQRLIFYEGEFEKRKLTLARAIGLPLGQQFRLADSPPYDPLPVGVTLESTLERAFQQRADYQAAQAQVRAAEHSKAAAQAQRYPSVALDASYGVIGPAFDRTHGTFAVNGGMVIPVFQGGRIQADVDAADAVLRQRRAELDDLRGRVDADVRTAFINLRSASQQVEVAVENINLARQQVQQAQDRFTAGVTNNLEVVQAQQALALANENHISALYTFNSAKAQLVRARGDAEQSIQDYLKRVK